MWWIKLNIKLGAVPPFLGGRAGSPSSTMWPGPTPTSIPVASWSIHAYLSNCWALVYKILPRRIFCNTWGSDYIARFSRFSRYSQPWRPTVQCCPVDVPVKQLCADACRRQGDVWSSGPGAQTETSVAGWMRTSCDKSARLDGRRICYQSATDAACSDVITCWCRIINGRRDDGSLPHRFELSSVHVCLSAPLRDRKQSPLAFVSGSTSDNLYSQYNGIIIITSGQSDLT